MVKIFKWLLWLWSPEYQEDVVEDEGIIEDRVITMDDLTRIREQRLSLQRSLLDLDKAKVAVEKTLMTERINKLVGCLEAFADEIRTGQALWDFREVQKAIAGLQEIDKGFINQFAKSGLLDADEGKRRFLINFVDKMSKQNSDFGTALEYIGSRRKPSNPFMKGGMF
jgi:hypothetical protein